MIGKILLLIVAFQHIAFAVIEMFYWTKPLGRKIFRTDEEFAEKSKVLAANQGLYNFFLVAGLLCSFFLEESAAHYFRFFFLTCVILAGSYGGYSIRGRVFLIQAVPAMLALFFVIMGL